jgi:hypothetical protein
VIRIDRRFLVPIVSATLLLAGAACDSEEGPTMPGQVQEQQEGDNTGTDETPAGGSVGSDEAGADNEESPPNGTEDLPTGSE